MRGSAATAPTAAVFLSPSGSDANACTRTAPCASFDRAYRAAQPGQIVELAAGEYPEQMINPDSSKTSAAHVLFRPAAGASVTVDGMTVDGSHITMQGFTVKGDWQTDQVTNDVTFRNLTVNGGIFANSSSNISVIGGSVGGIQNYKPQIGAWPPGTHNSNILIDGVTFHDVTRTDDSIHVECLLVAGIVGLTVENSTFKNCGVFDLSIGELNGSGPPANIVIQNNFFGGSDGFFSLDFNTNTTALTNVLIRNNSSSQEMYLGNDIAQLTNVRVIANVAPYHGYSCDDRISYAYNVWDGARCGATDVNAPLKFRDPANSDFHLLPGSRAIGHGDPSSFPPRDIDGQRRPQGKRIDAGADQTPAPPKPKHKPKKKKKTS